MDIYADADHRIAILRYLHDHLLTASQEDGHVEVAFLGSLDEFTEAVGDLCEAIGCELSHEECRWTYGNGSTCGHPQRIHLDGDSDERTPIQHEFVP